MAHDNSKRIRRDGSILYQLLKCGLKRPTSDTESIERIIHGADTLQIFIGNLNELAKDQSPLWNQIRFAALSERGGIISPIFDGKATKL